MRPLGVTTAARSPVLPNVPTIAEVGRPRLRHRRMVGRFAPAGLPAAIQAKLAKDCADAVQTPGMQGKLLQLGATPIGSTSDVLAKVTRDDYDKWGPVIKAAGLKID